MAYSGRFIPKNTEKYEGNYTNIVWRSTWERSVFRWCDENPDVKSWSSEEIVIPYYSPVDNKMHRYFVDLKVTFNNGATLLIEIKPNYQTKAPDVKKVKNGKKAQMRLLTEAQTFAVNDAKWKAADEFAKQRGWKFVIFTENTLHDMGIRITKKRF